MLVLLDQENISYNGLVGKDILSKDDKIVTFIGKDARISEKLIKVLNECICEVDIQKVLVGTKNAADYQLIAYLTHSLINSKFEEIVILSRDSGFDISLNYLKDKYPDKKLFRFQNLLEYYIVDFLLKELNFSYKESIYLSDLLLSNVLMSDEMLKDFLINKNLENIYEKLIPYHKDLKTLIYRQRLDFSYNLFKTDTSSLNYLKKQFKKINNPREFYGMLGYLLDKDIDFKKQKTLNEFYNFFKKEE